MYKCCVFLGENHIVCVMAEQIMFRREGKEKTDASTRPENLSFPHMQSYILKHSMGINHTHIVGKKLYMKKGQNASKEKDDRCE